jgi:hypothetical protein
MADKEKTDVPYLTSPGGLVSSGGFVNAAVSQDKTIRTSEPIANKFGGFSGAVVASRKKDARPINEAIDTGEE